HRGQLSGPGCDPHWQCHLRPLYRELMTSETNFMWDAQQTSIFLGASRMPDDTYQKAEELLLKYANRHGIITGATGTGKTVTLQILAEAFSDAGVPVFCADI